MESTNNNTSLILNTVCYSECNKIIQYLKNQYFTDTCNSDDSTMQLLMIGVPN